MSYWNARKQEDEKYVVVRHKLHAFNGHVNGIRFRDGFGVLIKDSKEYNIIKKLPLINSSEEYALEHLLTLKCITRDRDVETIFGKDVFEHYSKIKNHILKTEMELKKEFDYEEHVKKGLCSFIKPNGDSCGLTAYEHSLRKVCKLHILEDKELIEKLNMSLPDKDLNRDEQKKYRARIFKKFDK